MFVQLLAYDLHYRERACLTRMAHQVGRDDLRQVPFINKFIDRARLREAIVTRPFLV